MPALTNMALVADSSVTFTPHTSAAGLSPRSTLPAPRWVPTSELEHAVSTLTDGPCSENVYDSRPEATLSAPPVALKALTLWPAHHYWESETKGSLEVGKLADFVVLSENPLAIDPDRLAELKVTETIKEGVGVYRA